MLPVQYRAMLALYAMQKASLTLALACDMLKEDWSFDAGLIAAEASLSVLLPNGL